MRIDWFTAILFFVIGFFAGKIFSRLNKAWRVLTGTKEEHDRI